MKNPGNIGLIFICLIILFSCKTPQSQERHYVDYQPYFDQSSKVYVQTPSVKDVKLDTLVQVLSNFRPEEYNYNDTLSFVEEIDFPQGELIIDVDSINEKPPIFDTFMVVEKFYIKEDLVNTLFPIIPDSIKNILTNDSVKLSVKPPAIKKAPQPHKAVKPAPKKKYKPKKYVMPSYVRTVKGRQKYVPKRSPYRKTPSSAKPKPVKQSKPVVAPASSKNATPLLAKKEARYYTREEILADTTRDLLDADTIIQSIFSSTGWMVGDSIPYYKGYSDYSADSTIKLDTKMVLVEIFDSTREVKQYPMKRLSREVIEKKLIPDQIVYTDRVVFQVFYNDEEDVFVKMIRVQGGGFKIGSNEFDEDERPEYGLNISDFLIGKYEITNKIFCVFLNVLRCDSLGRVNRTKFIDWKSRYSKIFWDYRTGRFKVLNGFDDYPVVNITWAAANKVCKEMGGQLPSEAQWEYAAKGGLYAIRYYTNLDRTDYAYEQRFAGSNMMRDIGWFVDNSEGSCQMVGGLAPNRLEIYDMCGNVWEWCYDNYDREFYKRNSDNSDPVCIISNGIRVNRGGSWSSDAMYCRITNRNFTEEFQPNPYLGFRLMREWKK